MKRLTINLAVLLLCVLRAFAAGKQQDKNLTISVSGSCVSQIDNIGAVTNVFEEVVNGAPATLSVVVYGVMAGGTNVAEDTYTGTTSAIRTISKYYDSFQVCASWTGGSSPSVVVNHSGLSARLGSAGSGGAQISGTPTAGHIATWLNATTIQDGGLAGSGNTTSTALTTNKVSKANSPNSIVDSAITDDGTNLTYGGTGGFVSTAAGGAFWNGTEGNTACPVTASGHDILCADSTTHRATLENNGGAKTPVGLWPATTAGDVIVGGTPVGGVAPETVLAGNTVGTKVLSENASGVAAWISNTTTVNSQACTLGGTCTLTLDVIGAAAAPKTWANGNFPLAFTFAQTTNSQAGLTVGETSAATGGTLTGSLANQANFSVSTATGSTATPFNVTQGSVTGTVAFPAAQIQTTWNNASLVGRGLVIQVTDTSSAVGSAGLTVLGGAAGTTVEFQADKGGNLTVAGNVNFPSSTTISTTATASSISILTAAGTGVNNSGALNFNTGNYTGTTASKGSGAITVQPGNLTAAGAVSTDTVGTLNLLGGLTTAATNLAGGDVIVASGPGTGNSTPAHLKLQSPTFSVTSGTTAQTLVTDYVVHKKAGSTTSATATNMFQIPVATNQTIGVEVLVHVETTQATPHNCSTTEIFVASVQNTASTITQQMTAGSIGTICDTGTLTLAAAFSGATPSVFSVTPSWTTIVPTAVIITVEVRNLSQQDIALL